MAYLRELAKSKTPGSTGWAQLTRVCVGPLLLWPIFSTLKSAYLPPVFEGGATAFQSALVHEITT